MKFLIFIAASLLIFVIVSYEAAPVKCDNDDDDDETFLVTIATILDDTSCAGDDPVFCLELCEMNLFRVFQGTTFCKLRSNCCLPDSGECTCTYDCSFP